MVSWLWPEVLCFADGIADGVEALLDVGRGVFGVFLVFECDDARVALLPEEGEEGRCVEVAFADFGELGGRVGAEAHVFEMEGEEAFLEGAGGLEGVFAGAEVVSGVDAHADAGVASFEDVDTLLDASVEAVFGSVVVDGDVDAVLFDEAVEEWKRFRGG
ncbi:MAG: hypothetical protein RMJ43_07125 [Chloroherpetonaceae bacterium]|nr:hypothetical protein [Chloroherpetonaceae bacterium]